MNAAIYVGGFLVLVVIGLFWHNPEKAQRLLGTFALFFKSVEKTRAHKREDETEPHAHTRKPRKSLAMSIIDFARPSKEKKPEDIS